MRPGINNVRAFIESSNIGEKNKKNLLWFDMKNANDGLTDYTREMHMRFLFKLAEYLKEKPFRPITPSRYTLEDTHGCSCEQILDIKPWRKRWETRFGCTGFTLFRFINQYHF